MAKLWAHGFKVMGLGKERGNKVLYLFVPTAHGKELNVGLIPGININMYRSHKVLQYFLPRTRPAINL